MAKPPTSGHHDSAGQGSSQQQAWERDQAAWASWASDAWNEVRHLLGSDDHLRREVEIRWRAQWLTRRGSKPDPLARPVDCPALNPEAAERAFRRLAERRAIILSIADRDAPAGLGSTEIDRARHWLQTEAGWPTLATIAGMRTKDGHVVVSIRPAPAIKVAPRRDPVPEVERNRRAAANASAWAS